MITDPGGRNNKGVNRWMEENRKYRARTRGPPLQERRRKDAGEAGHGLKVRKIQIIHT